MAEIAYARKYRPKSLDEYLGTEVKMKVRNRLKDEKNFPQTILLYGPPGDGKTTLDRLIAKEMQCTDRVNGCACGRCANCMTIEDELINAEFGSSTLGVTELDIGSEGGKDRVLELAEQVLMPPPYGYKYNIFILDECHMWTKQAQNALLKMLEELPPTTVIMLSTTDPDRLLEPVRDRCQLRIQVKPANAEELVGRLKTVAELEKLTVSEDALKLIVKYNRRNPRLSLNMLENVAKNYDKKVTVANVLKEHNEVGIARYEEYFSGAQSKDPIASTLLICEKLEAEGVTYKDFLDGLIDFVTTCISIKYGIGIEGETTESLMAAKKLFSSYTISDMDCLLQIMEYASKMLYTSSSTERLVLLTTAMRISKVKILEAGLQFVERDTAKETERGAEIHAAALNEEQGTIAKPLEVNEQVLSTVFGKQVKEIASGDNLSIASSNENISTGSESTETGDEEPTADEMTDEQLLALFSS